MGLIRAVFGLMNADARIQQNIENYLGTFRSRSKPSEPPCITLYDTYMLMTQFGVHQWFRTPPVVNNICSLYSCVTPPNCAIALAHQVSVSTEPKCYRDPRSDPVTEFHRILREFTDEDGRIDIKILTERFERINGHARVYHPEHGIEFGISPAQTLKVFEEWNKDEAILQVVRGA